MVLLTSSCSSQMKPLNTVPAVDLVKYSGKWYEIARLPNSFEKGLICVTAEYSLRPVIRIWTLTCTPDYLKSHGKMGSRWRSC